MRIATVLFAVALLAQAFGADLVLKPGETEIVADETKDAFAVGELKTLLGEAFGAEIPVVFAPSGTKKTIALAVDPSFARDAIRLATDAGGVRITCGAARTCGVYEFLERYAGMRFYFPGPLGTVVPKRTELRVPFGTVDVKPDYTQRACDMSWGNNGRWYSLRGEGEADRKEATELRRLAAARMRLAPRLMCCHGLDTEFHLLKRFGESHPEYFALMKAPDGTLYRDAARSKWTGHRGQICHTSGVWDEIYRETVRRLKAGETTIDVMAQDGMQKCLCEKCQAAYSKDPDDPQWAADLIWGRTVELANRLTAAGVRGNLTQMIYTPYRRLPETKLPPNVLVMVAANGAWTLGDPAKTAQEYATIRGYAEKIGHKVWIWNYTGKFGSRQKNVDIPQMSARAIGKYYGDLSDAIFGSYMESRTDRWIYNYLNYYVYNKVSWNTKVDVDALLKEHDRLMFGAGAAEMRAYYDRLEELWMNRVCNNVVDTDLGPVVREPTPYQKWVDIYTPAVLAAFDGYLARALAKVRPDSLEARRIAFIRRHFQDPLRKASEAYLDRADAERNSIRRAGRENTSILKGTRFDAPEEIVLDGETPQYRNATQSLNGRLKPSTKYRVSYFLRQTNVVAKAGAYNGGVSIRLFDGKDGPVHPKPIERIGSRDWLYCEYEQTTAPEIGDNPYVRIAIEGATGTAWFKGIRIEEVAE